MQNEKQEALVLEFKRTVGTFLIKFQDLCITFFTVLPLENWPNKWDGLRSELLASRISGKYCIKS